MALYADRVKDSTSITGTGAITLSGTAPTGFQSFATAFGATPQTVAYCIADQIGNNWEVGTGVFNGTTGLTRVTVLASSNGGSLVNFSGGTQDVFCTAPAAYLLPAGSTTQIQFNNAGVFGASANFTYATGTNTFTVGPAGATTTIETLAPTGSTVAGALLIRGKTASATNGAGGGLQFAGGTALGTGTGGGLNFSSGQSPSGIGGGIDFTSGAGGSSGGTIAFISGNGSPPNGSGGAFSMNAGVAEGTGTGGRYEMLAGNNSFGSGVGGDFYLQTGGSGSNVSGNFQILIGGGGAGSGTIILGTDSNVDCFRVTEASGVSQMGFFNATPVTKPAPTASGTGNVLSSVVTALNSLGLVSSASLTNASTLTAAGSNTQIQFNNSNAFGASANFTFNSTTSTVNLGATTGSATYTTRVPTTAQNPIGLIVAAQNSIRTTGTSPGGTLTLLSGNGRPTGAGNGGALSITSGNAGTTGNGGAINITSGNGGTTSGNGGDFNLISGSGEISGIVNLIAGNGTVSPGYVRGQGGGFVGFSSGAQFQCGNGTLTNGGSVFFLGGNGDTGGNIELTPGIGSTTNGFATLNNAFSNSGLKVAGASGAPTIGFYGATPIVKPTVTGSRASGAALQDLLTQLANLGLITDSTTI